MGGMNADQFGTGILALKNIVPCKPEEAKELFLAIGAKQDVKRGTVSGSRLISGAIDVLEHLARRGFIIENLSATGRTRDGLRLSKGSGFTQISLPAKKTISCAFSRT
jgi:hypothetical protein